MAAGSDDRDTRGGVRGEIREFLGTSPDLSVTVFRLISRLWAEVVAVDGCL
jgi:hypothetical protein